MNVDYISMVDNTSSIKLPNLVSSGIAQNQRR